MGLIGLLLREYFITSSSASSAFSSSSSSSSTITSFVIAFLSPLISLTSSLKPSLIFPLTRSLLSRCNRFNKIYNYSNNYNRFNKIYEELSYIDIYRFNIRDTMKDLAVVFLIKLLSLLKDLKKSDLIRILLNFYLISLIANLFIRFYITLRVITYTLF